MVWIGAPFAIKFSKIAFGSDIQECFWDCLIHLMAIHLNAVAGNQHLNEWMAFLYTKRGRFYRVISIRELAANVFLLKLSLQFGTITWQTIA